MLLDPHGFGQPWRVPAFAVMIAALALPKPATLQHISVYQYDYHDPVSAGPNPENTNMGRYLTESIKASGTTMRGRARLVVTNLHPPVQRRQESPVGVTRLPEGLA